MREHLRLDTKRRHQERSCTGSSCSAPPGQAPGGSTTDVSEHFCHDRGRTRPARETLARHRPHPVRLATAARPETHQNLIHSNKDQAPGLVPGVNAPNHMFRTAPTASPHHPQNNLPKQLAPEQSRQHRTSCFSARPPMRSASPAGSHQPPQHHPQTWETAQIFRNLVEVIGLEPTTPCLQSRCSPS